MLVTYKGNNTALTVHAQGKAYRLVPSQPVVIEDAQVDELKKQTFIKTLIDADMLDISNEPKDNKEPNAKPVSKMTVADLEAYIIENDGEFAESDNKPELLIIAQAIEDSKAE